MTKNDYVLVHVTELRKLEAEEKDHLPNVCSFNFLVVSSFDMIGF